MTKLIEQLSNLKTPCYVIDEKLLIKNLEILKRVEDETGCKILLAQKAYSAYSTYPLIGKYLHGVTSSSLFEARLGYEEMGKEVHIYAPAYRDDEIDDIIKYSDHIVFNSFNQWNKFKDKIKNADKKIECGIRINPEYSEVDTEIYDPCSKSSRLGVTADNFEEQYLDEIDGLHFHTMCEQNSDTLERTIKVVEEKFGKYFNKIKWINFGGGHHITRDDYDVDKLIKCILYIKNKYNIQVYLEPGEAVALNAGYLVSTVLDIVENSMHLAIMDTSAACHMPDVIEMPYRPNIIGSKKPSEGKYTYRLGGPTCLAGDIIGDYSFDNALKVGDKLIFCDMAIYSMVKNNTFNGINLPDIVLLSKDGDTKVIKEFNYNNFKARL
ncbi:carboxynorspermidine decarboxylase [Clostridium sp. MSJ-8]|uniref:carboxynorspermidine decarboxylase n=1 Tax=Clostridium sp. MSJ-8 TaxID=2841510 RepID=UPI001C0EF716|nr:carboxynorspermidine decarboxylase [Clostridium sp. MSJ-8]MBU5487469.1 carboxynorspermidine decarboxylase [Clostridium sp. MSJ-8]